MAGGAQGKDRGSAAVEFALILPVLLLLVFGIIDFGRLLNAKITLNQAAHEGARAAAVQGEDAARATIAKVLGGMAGGAGDPTITACGPQPLPGEDATVTVTYHFNYVTPLAILGGFGDANGNTLTATAVVPCL